MLRTIPYPPRSNFPGDHYRHRNQLHHPPPPSVATMPPAPIAAQPARRSPSSIASKAYKNSTNLFLTRRLAEALSGLEPIIHGSGGGSDDGEPAMAQIPKALRIKLWSLYLAIMDAAAKMTPSEGKTMWGPQEWPQIVSRIRSGEVWEEVNRAYGDEGRVDAEVVVTLATLLLSHSPDQTITQKRIEAFIGAMPSLHETEDPKSILQRQKISEIYILHVLPRVGEWEYAKEFTQFSPDIDEEQKEAFYSTLDQLKKDMEAAELHSQELALQREAELAYEAALALEDSPPPSTARSNRSVSRRREPSTTGRTRAPSVRPGTARASSTVRGEISPKRGAATAERKTKRQASVSQHKDAAAVTRKATTVKTGQPRGQSSMIRGLSGMLQKLHQGVVGNGPLALLRALLMIAMVAWMGSNKKVRERIRKVIMICWVKVARTVGMGMKVTYV